MGRKTIVITGASGGIVPRPANQVAEMNAALIDIPQPELHTNPASADMAWRYFENIGAFEDTLLKA